MELLKIYLGDITYKDTDDGCVEVYGKATGPDLDLDYQICDPVWLAKAMPGWMETGANVRAMHLAIAAGIGIELAAIDESWFLKSLIVDANEVLKVKKKVYKGYSIGIANAQVIKDGAAPNGRIVGGDIVEISIVDRPANPTALMELCKMAKDPTGVEALGFVTKVGEASPAEKITKAGEPNGLDVIGANPVTDPGVDPPNNVVTATPCPDCSAGINADSAPCETCGGTGLLPRTDKAAKDCATCKGTGKIKDGSTKCPDCAGSGNAKFVETDEFGWSLEEKAEWSDLQKALFPDLEKKKYTDAERTEMASSGKAMPGGGFPIDDVEDLKNAIQAIGRAKDPAAAKKHIKARAKALGQSSLIPDDWKAVSIELAKVFDSLIALKAVLVTKGATADEWMHDPTLVNAVISGLATFLKQEIDELVAGQDERWDIEDLSWILSAFISWVQHEFYEGETPSPFGQGDDDMANVFVSLGVKPELLKVASDDAATDEQRAEARTEIVKALGLGEVTELTALLKAAAEREQSLEDRVAQVEEMAAPGGPAKRATANQQQKSDQAQQLRTEATKFMEIAATLTDPGRKRLYIGKAQQAQSDADALERV